MANPTPTDDQDETVTTASGKQVVLPPPPGQSSALYNAEPADSKGDDSPYTTDFLKRFDPTKTDTLNKGLADIERQRGQAEQSQFGSLNRKMEQDRAQMEKAFTAESASADSIPPPWNADKEQRERVRSPIEDFGSIGSIFGIIASQFTKTPLTSAMNAAAAAMNATREHDEEGYKTAYDAWKENTALALKRFGMERELYEDANKLIETDISQWKVKQLQIAAQFDNKKAIAMLDAGMNGELMDLQAKQVDMASKLQKTMDDQETVDIRRSIFSAESKAWDKDHPDAKPQEKAQARLDILRGIAEGGRNVQTDLLREFRLQNPHATAEDEADFLQKHQVGRAGMLGGAPTKQKEIARRIADFKAKHPDAGDDEVDQEYDRISQEVANASQPSMSPNKRVDMERNVTEYNESVKTIDDSVNILQTHVGSAGLAGRATRTGERVENIFGGNNTDRVQFMRNIEYLQSAAQKLLFDRQGRPLSADASRINDIIGGLNIGDTTANTLRSLKEVKERLQRLQKSQQDQLGGKWTPAPSTAKPAGSSDKPAWEEAPIVQPKVDIGAPTSP